MVPYTCGIQSTEAECNSSIETKPTLYLQATTAGLYAHLNVSNKS